MNNRSYIMCERAWLEFQSVSLEDIQDFYADSNKQELNAEIVIMKEEIKNKLIALDNLEKSLNSKEKDLERARRYHIKDRKTA